MVKEDEIAQLRKQKVAIASPSPKGIIGDLEEAIMFDRKRLRQRGLISTGHHLPYNPKLKLRARALRNNMTEAEKKLWHGFLKHQQYSVLRQKPIDNYIVDFYCAKVKLIIEVDGQSHESDDAIEYDEQRDEILQSYGLKMLRIKNEEVINEFEKVCAMISKAINVESSYSPPLIKEDGMSFVKTSAGNTSPSSKGIIGDLNRAENKRH